MKPLLSLVAILKDEAASINKVLEAAKPFVDRWTILDTGSTDGTQEIVREVMKDLQGKLIEEPFVDFATSRNRVMQLDRGAEFQLMLSGDEFLRDGPKLREQLEESRDSKTDCFAVRVAVDDSSTYSPRVFRTGSAWQYRGVIHEFPAHPDKAASIEAIKDSWIEHIVSDPEKRLSNIWENHIPLLQSLIEKDPNDARSLIFLAQSYEALFAGFSPEEKIQYAKEAMNLYARRLALPCETEAERNYIMLRYLDVSREVGVYTNEEMFKLASALREKDPSRPETAFLCADAAMRVRSLPEVYALFCNAAIVAEQATQIFNSSPISVSFKWKSHYYAAVAAKQIAEKKPSMIEETSGKTYAVLVRDHIASGLATGGSWSIFKQLSSPVKQEAVPAQTTS